MTDRERIKKAVEMIFRYGSIDGGMHKQWLIDQILRILVTDYDYWISEYKKGEDGPETYEWDTGIAP